MARGECANTPSRLELSYMKGRRSEALTANRGRPVRVGDSMQRLAMDVSGVVAFIRVTEYRAAKF